MDDQTCDEWKQKGKSKMNDMHKYCKDCPYPFENDKQKEDCFMLNGAFSRKCFAADDYRKRAENRKSAERAESAERPLDG